MKEQNLRKMHEAKSVLLLSLAVSSWSHTSHEHLVRSCFLLSGSTSSRASPAAFKNSALQMQSEYEVTNDGVW